MSVTHSILHRKWKPDEQKQTAEKTEIINDNEGKTLNSVWILWFQLSDDILDDVSITYLSIIALRLFVYGFKCLFLYFLTISQEKCIFNYLILVINLFEMRLFLFFFNSKTQKIKCLCSVGVDECKLEG